MINETVKNGLPPQAPVRDSAPVLSVASTSVAEVKAAAPATEATKAAPPDAKQLEAAVAKLNDYVQSIRRTLSFSIEESTGRTVIKVYDAETDELIRQIPPEDTLRLANSITQNPSLLIKERA